MDSELTTGDKILWSISTVGYTAAVGYLMLMVIVFILFMYDLRQRGRRTITPPVEGFYLSPVSFRDRSVDP